MKFPDIFGIIVCWIVRKRMKWFPRWREYFVISEMAHARYAEFSAALKEYASQASVQSRGFLTTPQADHALELYMQSLALWTAADRLMHAPDMHHITTGEEPA